MIFRIPLGYLERLVCGLFGSKSYWGLPICGHGLAPIELAKRRRDAKYYATGNAIRLTLFIPVAWALSDGPFWAFGAALAVIATHFLLGAVEWFRLAILMELKADGHEPYHEPCHEHPRVHPYFGPFRWETESLYRRIGMEYVQRWLLQYQDWARGISEFARPDLLRARAGAARVGRVPKQDTPV